MPLLHKASAYCGRGFLCMFVAMASLCFTACDKDSLPPSIDNMESYYIESCNLRKVEGDSIQRFATKVVTYVNHFPEEKSSPYYPDIVANIKDAARAGNITIVVTINTDWEGEQRISF